MKAEFLKDENGCIWFFFAQNIQVRPPKTKNYLYELQPSASSKAQDQREQLLTDIQHYQNEG